MGIDDERDFWNLLKQFEAHWTLELSEQSPEDDYWKALLGVLAHAVLEHRCAKQRLHFWTAVLAVFDFIGGTDRHAFIAFLKENGIGPNSPFAKLREFVDSGCESGTSDSWYDQYVAWLFDWIRRRRDRDNSR